MSKPRIAVIGAGMIGAEHARMTSTSTAIQLAGIADSNRAAGDIAARYSVPFFEDYRAMLDELMPDGVIVALPNHLHLEAGLVCVERGLPAIIEKPVTDTVESALRLVAASEKANVPLLVGHHRRHSPDIRTARDTIANGKLGKLIAVNGMWFVKKQASYFEGPGAWRKKSGGGPFLINLIHDIDCFRYLCGEIESVHAIATNKNRGFEVEDTASIILEFQNGALGTFVMSDLVPSPWVWDMAACQAPYFPFQPGDCYFLGGTDASLAIPTGTLWWHADNGDWRDPMQRQRLPADLSNCYANQYVNFAGVIAGTAKPVIDARDGMMTLAATLAVAESARSRRSIKVCDVVERAKANVFS